MSIKTDVQKLEPGRFVELFELDATGIGGEIVRFHKHLQVGDIWWAGEAYSPWPIETEGFAMDSAQPSTPKLRVSNVNGSISALCIYFDDLLGAKLTVIRTLAKYLDAINFPDGNPTADPTQEMPRDIWYIERKSAETKEVVEFELASALDLNGVTLPRRKIIASRCLWLSIGGYRGPYCGYVGAPVAKRDGTPTSDPMLDACGGLVSDCKLRFGEDGQLPFGGYPAAGLMRT